MGFPYHRAEHWWFLNGGKAISSDRQNPRYGDFYGPAQIDPEKNPPDTSFLSDWLARLGELVEQYQPQLVYFDWWIEQPAFNPLCPVSLLTTITGQPNGTDRGRYHYKQHDFFKDRHAFAEGSARYDIERGQLMRSSPPPALWQSDTSISGIPGVMWLPSLPNVELGLGHLGL